MNDPITIPKELPKDTALSYDFLLEEGIKTIQELSGNRWTDHNEHDPGIAILEQVCYAITDLAYRLDYSITDLLGNNEEAYKELYSPATILTTNPVTLLDYRKIIIDTEGVKNAWIEKVTKSAVKHQINEAPLLVKGLYKVVIEKDDVAYSTLNLAKNVNGKLQATRGVCEDFDEVVVLNKQELFFGGTIEISDNSDDINQLVVDILYRLHLNLSPGIPFYTLPELQAKGKRIDEIFEGPTLTHGFIDDEELQKNTRKHEVHASDMIKEIMDVAHVVTVQNFSIESGTNSVKNWVFPLDKTKTPSLNAANTLNNFTFKVGGLDANIDKNRITKLYEAKIRSTISKRPLRLEEKDIAIRVGEDRAVANYYSIQNQFPLNFGIGTTGLPNTASKKRKAQSKQLVAYLTFFDQILANYFSQVANFSMLIGFSSTNYATTFNQSLLGKVTNLENVLKNTQNYTAYLNENSQKTVENLQRKNQFLNHLLARYSEKFTAYGMLTQHTENTLIEHEEKLIQDKIAFLKEYPLLSSQRGKAFDYTTKAKQKSGLEKRLIKKLGISNAEDFLMIEHILLRPQSPNDTSFYTYYQKNEVATFEAVADTTNIKCSLSNEILHPNELIAIYDAGEKLGIFTVLSATEAHFEVDLALEQLTPTSKISWQRVTPDIRYQTLTNAITAFEATSNSNTTFCKATHQLHVGNEVKIVGTNSYDGIHKIINTTATGFEIQIPYVENETAGRFFNLQQQKDPYSLQVTFVLPSGKGRYKNPAFKSFAENTIREESPVHITIHTKWVEESTMQNFKENYKTFLSKMN